MQRSAIATALILPASLICPARAASVPWMDSSMGLLQGELTARFGPGQRLRVRRGLAQVARFWQIRDGGAGEFESFVRAQFAGEPEALDALFRRAQAAMASLDAHLLEIRQDFSGAPKLPIDALLAGLDPGTHLAEDCFRAKVAFAVLLNFPLPSPQERLRDGPSWTARQWAEVRLAERFSRRAPAEAGQAAAGALAAES